MSGDGYWQKRSQSVLRRAASRRRFLYGGGAALLGAAAAACSSNNNKNSSAAKPAASATSAGASTRAAGAATAAAPTAATKSATAAAAASPPAKVTRGGTLVFASPHDDVSIDPAVSVWTEFRAASHAVCDALIAYDEKLQPASTGLAEKWEIADPQTVVLHLRQGVSFHNGQPFNSAAVKWNIDRVKDPKVGAKEQAAVVVVDHVETPDPQTATLKLSTPSASLIAVLGDRAGLIVAPDTDPTKQPIGTGPFTFKSRTAGSNYELAANKSYWRQGTDGKPLPYLDGYRVTVVPDEAQIANNLRAAQAQGAVISTNLRKQFASDKSFALIDQISRGFQSIYINMAAPPLTDVRIRQALAYGFDRQGYIQSVLGGVGTPAISCFAPQDWVFDGNVSGYNTDLQKAKQLVQASGLTGDQLTIQGWSSPSDTLSPAFAADNLSKFGLKYDVKSADTTTVINEFLRGGKGGATVTGFAGRADPDLVMAVLFEKDATNQIAHYVKGWTPDPDIEALIQKGRQTYTMEDRKPIYRDLAKKINELVYGQVFVAYQNGGWATTANVKSLPWWDDGIYRIREAWMTS